MAIVDVLHRFTYEVTGQDKLKSIELQLAKNAEVIALNERSLVRLRKLLSETNDASRQDKINAAIENRTAAINKESQGIKNAIQTDKQFQDALKAEIEIIGQLNKKLESLRNARSKALSASGAKQIAAEIAQIEQQQSNIVSNRQNSRYTISAGRQTPHSNVLVSPVSQASAQSVAAMRNELGIIQQLNKRLDELRIAREKALSTKEIAGYNQQIRQVEGEMGRLMGNRGSILGSVLQGVGIGSGIQIFNTAFNSFKSAIDDASRLAAETEGVRVAFMRLGRADLLDDLRKATRGTVSDLELMKQAVQFSNFGLPVERLATALEFARIRAKETGQSVEYLVQSIVTGVGRQSALILDNLGISAKRVTDEFKRTGDFAKAAFNIIQEESKKAGIDIETYAEQQARIAAEFENIKAQQGEAINYYKGWWSAQLLDTLNDVSVLFGNTEFAAEKAKEGYKSATEMFEEGERKKRKAAEETAAAQKQQQDIFLKYFKDYADSYAKADLKNREIIQEQASNMYQVLRRENEMFIRQDSESFSGYFDRISRGYSGLLNQTALAGAFSWFEDMRRKAPVNLRAESVQSIAGLDKERLQLVSEEIKKFTETSNDTKEIIRLREIDNAIQRRLLVINGEYSKIAEENAQKEKERYEKAKERLRLQADTARVNDEVLKSLNSQIDNQRLSYQAWLTSAEGLNASLAERTAKERQFNEGLKTIQQLRAMRLQILAAEDIQRQLAAAERFNKKEDIQKLTEQLQANYAETIDLRLQLRVRIATSITSLRETANDFGRDLKAAVDKEINDAAKYAESAQDRINKDYEKKQAAARKNKEKNIFGGDSRQDFLDAVDLYGELTNAAVQAYNTIADAKQRQIERELQYQEYAIQQAQILAERGNVEELRMQEERSRKLREQQRKAAREQQIVNNALVVSNALVAVAKSAAEGGAASFATIAATIAALVAGYSFVRSFSEPVGNYAKGVIDLKGPGTSTSDSIPANLSRGESVITAQATQKYKPILEQIQAMTFKIPEHQNASFMLPKTPAYSFSEANDLRKEFSALKKEMSGIREAIYETKVNVSQRMDADGLAQSVTKYNNRVAKSFR